MMKETHMEIMLKDNLKILETTKNIIYKNYALTRKINKRLACEKLTEKEGKYFIKYRCKIEGIKETIDMFTSLKDDKEIFVAIEKRYITEGIL